MKLSRQDTTERRCEQIAADIESARRDFADGKCAAVDVDDLMREITS